MSFFSIEQLGGDFPLLGADLRGGVPVAAFGLSDAVKYLVGAVTERRTLYITADAISAKRAAAAISALSGKKCALLSAKDEVLTYRKAYSKDSLFRRLCALHEWEKGADVLIADVEALIQLIPNRVPSLTLTVGAETDMGALIDTFISWGYTREYSVEGKGALAVRGDILDIYPVNCEHPVRVDFFGDEVEAIKPYDEITGERYAQVSSLDIIAATDARIEEQDRAHVEEAFKEELRRAPNAAAYDRMRTIADDILANGGSDFILPLLKSTTNIFELLPKDTLLVFDECKPIRDKLKGLYAEHTRRHETLYEGGESMLFSAFQYIPEDSFSSFNAWRCLALQTFAGDVGFFNPLKIYNFNSVPARRYLNSMPDFFTDLRAWQKTGYRVLVYSGSAERKKKLQDALSDEGFHDVPCPPPS